MKGGIIGYPALTVEDDKIYLRLHDDADRAARLHREGVIQLLAEKLHGKIKYLKKNLSGYTEMSLHYRKVSNDIHLFEDIMLALIERVCLHGETPRSKKAFDAALAAGEQHLVSSANELGKQLAEILKTYSRINERLRSVKHKSAKADISRQLGRLIFPGFIRQTPAKRIPDLARYLKSIDKRLDKLDREPLKDAQRQKDISEWDDKLEEWLKNLNISKPLERANDAQKQMQLLEYFYMLEEYRVQVFAQEVGAKGKVSCKLLQEMSAI